MNRTAAETIADDVLALPTQEERKARARDLCIYALATVAALEGKQAATEFAYRAADAAVGIFP